MGDALLFLGAKTDGLSRDLAKAEKQTQSWAKRAGANIGNVLGTAVKVGALAAGAAVVGLGAGLVKLAADAAPLANIKAAFEGIADNADETLRRLRTGSLGLVRDIDLMTNYNKAAQLVGVTFAEQLPDAMGYLAKVSASTGQDIGYMLDSLTTGIGRLSPMILDNLGITVDLSAAYETYAATIGKTASELTKAEQQTALMNQVLEKLAENTKDMPELQVAPWDRFRVSMSNLGDAIGLAFLPALLALTEPLAAFMDRIAPGVAAAAEGLASGISGAITALSAISLADIFGEETADKIIAALDGVKGKVVEWFGIETNWGQVFKDAVITAKEAWAGEWQDDAKLILPVHRVVGNVTTKIRELRDTLVTILGDPNIRTVILVMVGIIGLIFAPVTTLMGLVALLGIAYVTNWNNIREKTEEVWGVIGPLFDEFISDVGEGMPASIQALKDAFGEGESDWDTFIADLQSAVDWGNRLADALNGISSWLNTVARGIHEVFTLWDSGKDIFNFSDPKGGSKGSPPPGGSGSGGAGSAQSVTSNSTLFAAGSIVIQGNASSATVKQGVQEALRASGLA